MKLISVENLKEGMTVAGDVLTLNSQCLISKGTVITEPLKKSLVKYKISEIMVEEDMEDNPSPELRSDIEFECWEIVMNRFRTLPESPFMKCVFDIAVKIEMGEYFE